VTCHDTGRQIETTAMVSCSISNSLILGWQDVSRLGIKMRQLQQPALIETRNLAITMSHYGPIKGKLMQITLKPNAEPPPMSIIAHPIPVHK